MRLIDADAQFCEEASDGTGYVLAYAGGIYAVTDEFGHVVCEFMPEQPTVDAAPEVRCRCCKHAKTAVSHPQWNCNHAQSPCYRRRVRGIDYCAYGEEWTGSDGEEEE